MNLVDGQMFRFDMDDEPGDAARVKLPHEEIINTLREVHKNYISILYPKGLMDTVDA